MVVRSFPRPRCPYFAKQSQNFSRGQPERPTVQQRRQFSQSSPQSFHASCRLATKLRRNMYAWLNGPGNVFREPLPGSTNYLGAYDKSGRLNRLRGFDPEEEEEEEEEDDDNAKNRNKDRDDRDDSEEDALDELERQRRKEEEEAEAEEERQDRNRNRLPKESVSDLRPFPLNFAFRSQSVLSEPLRQAIYKAVAEDGHSVATTSVLYGVDMRRVAAVVRLQTVEKEWTAQGRKLATPYASAVMSMLPQTKFNPRKPIPHESINDLPVHATTREQLFYPASESRQFTREDAAKAFDPRLLSADKRIPHSDLIDLERDIAAGKSRDARQAGIKARDDKKVEKKEQIEQKRRVWREENLQTVSGQRWDFKFENINVDKAGHDGRSRRGVGWRYGTPYDDRRRGQIKIPTSVE